MRSARCCGCPVRRFCRCSGLCRFFCLFRCGGVLLCVLFGVLVGVVSLLSGFVCLVSLRARSVLAGVVRCRPSVVVAGLSCLVRLCRPGRFFRSLRRLRLGGLLRVPGCCGRGGPVLVLAGCCLRRSRFRFLRCCRRRRGRVFCLRCGGRVVVLGLCFLPGLGRAVLALAGEALAFFVGGLFGARLFFMRRGTHGQSYDARKFPLALS